MTGNVWFEMNGTVFEGVVVEDDGGIEVLVSLDNGPTILVYRHLLTEVAA